MSLSDYKKKELRQHIYDTPDTYVGGVDLIEDKLPVYEDGKIVDTFASMTKPMSKKIIKAIENIL